MNARALVLDGALIPPDAPAYPPLERGLLYGDGLFESIPVHEQHPLDLDRHFGRMTASCTALSFPVPPRGAWDDSIALCLASSGEGVDSIRVTWSRGQATSRRFVPDPGDGPPRMLVAAYGLPAGRADRLARGVSAACIHGLTPGELARHKTLSAMTYVVAQSRARAQGADEALLVDDRDRVLESAGANVFVVREGRAFTPLAARPILAGIARERVQEWLGKRAQEVDFGPRDVAHAHEAFLTNAVSGVTPLVRVDGQAVGSDAPGPLTRELQKLWEEWRGSAAQRLP